MTDLELLQLDAIDRAERKLREIGTHPSLTRKQKFLRLFEAIRDDSFADLEDLVGGDLPFDAFWDDETPEAGTGWMAPGSGPVWWPYTIYHKRDPKDHSWWQGRYPFCGDPKTSKERKKKAWTSKPPMYTDGGPQDRPSPAKIAASPTRGVKPTAPLFVGIRDYNRKRLAEAIARDDREIEELVMLGLL
jgi:hypothetical protein